MNELLTLFGVIVTALCGVWIAYLSNRNKGLNKENIQLNKEKKDLSSGILVDLMSFNDIVHKINNVFNQTRCDRFLILTAALSSLSN